MAAVTARSAPGKDLPPASPKRRKAGERSLAVLLGRYRLDVQAQNFSPKTVKKMELGLGLFDDFMGGIVDVRRVQGDDLRRFIVHSRQRTLWPGMRQASQRHLAHATLRTYSQSVKVFWGWLHKKGVIHKNAMLDVALPRIGRKLPRTFTEAEAICIIVTTDSLRSRLLIFIFLDGGPRLCEVAGDDRHPGIFMEDIDFDTGTIKIRGKFGVERLAHVSPETLEVMRQYCQHERPQPVGPDKLLLNEDGTPMKGARVQKILESIGRKAGLSKRLSPHKLRHSKAVLSIKYGSNVEYQRRELGHRHLSTTQVYLDVEDEDVAAAHKVYSPVTNLLKRMKEKGMAGNLQVKPPDRRARKRPGGSLSGTGRARGGRGRRSGQGSRCRGKPKDSVDRTDNGYGWPQVGRHLGAVEGP